MRTFFPFSLLMKKTALFGLLLAVPCQIGAFAQNPPAAAPKSEGQNQEQQNQKSQEAKPADEIKPPEVPQSAAPVDPRFYDIGMGDVIYIKVWREPELTGLYTVRPDGRISMPLAGDIEALGASPELLKDRVTKSLSKTMVQPEILLEVRQINSKHILITGEVGRAGSYPLVTPITVLEALSIAGGLREFANGKKITILRGNERIRFNYKEVIKGKNMGQNITLKPGDHIIVP